MKALVYEGPEKLALHDVPEPKPGNGEVIVQVAAVGLCGSDMHAYFGHDERRPAPLILGHEAAGVVAGSGRRVTVNPLVACGVCPACQSGRDNICPKRQILSLPPREGAFAELIAIPEQNLVTVPDAISLEIAALAEPLACGWHAVSEARRILHEDLADAKCLVQGGGAIGVGAALALRAQGARDITLLEPNPTRIPTLDAIDGFAVASPDDYTTTPHLVIDAYGGAKTRAHASAIVRPGGLIVHIGLADSKGGLDTRRMTLQEIGFLGTYTYTAAAFRETAEMIFTGRLGPLDWPEIRPLSDGPAVFADAAAGRIAAPKVIFTPS